MTLRTAYRALAGAVLLITLEMMHCTMSVGADQPDRTGGVFQNIPTLAAYEWNFFADSGDAYLIGNMDIHKWMPSASCFGDGVNCGKPHQHLLSEPESRGRRVFTIGKERYLAVSIYYDRPSSSYRTNSLIYKWMAGSACFGDGRACGVALQKIASVGARDVEIIEIAGKRYLAVANYFDGSSYQGSLGLMEWLPESECFGAQAACNNLLQVVPVTAAFALDSISVGADTYLAVAIYFDGNSFQQNSLIYRWMPAQSCFGDGSACGAALQKLSTAAAVDVRHFRLDGGIYVGFAGFYNGSSFAETPSYVYKWLDTRSCFGDGTSCGAPFQVLPTGNLRGLEPFAIGPQAFLAGSNYYDGTSYSTGSKIYKWMTAASCFGSGERCGVPFQQIPTIGAAGWKSFVIGGNSYLVVANDFDGSRYDLNSSIYVWMPGENCFGDGLRCAGSHP